MAVLSGSRSRKVPQICPFQHIMLDSIKVAVFPRAHPAPLLPNWARNRDLESPVGGL